MIHFSLVCKLSMHKLSIQTHKYWKYNFFVIKTTINHLNVKQVLSNWSYLIRTVGSVKLNLDRSVMLCNKLAGISSFLLFCLYGTNIGYKHYKWLKGNKFCLGCRLQSATKDYTTRPLSRKGENQHNTTKDKIVGRWKINIKCSLLTNIPSYC